jgi:Flp pilus assembly protein TadG
MLETRRSRPPPQRGKRRQIGATAVEFAILALVFFMIVFGVIEIARAMFVLNTIQEVTRRAAAEAASTNFTDTAAMAAVRQRAVFRESPGQLVLAAPITDEYVRIDYLALLRDVDGTLTLQSIADTSLPASPAANRQRCVSNPNDATCIRFVRARICDPGVTAGCTHAPFTPALPLVNLTFLLPDAVTIVPAQSLGHVLGTLPE